MKTCFQLMIGSMLLAALATGCGEEKPSAAGGEGGALASSPLAQLASSHAWCTKSPAATVVVGLRFQGDGAAKMYSYTSMTGRQDHYPAGINWAEEGGKVYLVAAGTRVQSLYFEQSGDDLGYVTLNPADGKVMTSIELAECTAEQLSKLGL